MNTLKKAAITASLVAGFAASAMAEEVTLTGCTSDGQTATFRVDATGGINGGASTKDIVAKAFRETAKEFSSTTLLSNGYPSFVEKVASAIEGKDMSEDASIEILAAPTIGGPSCKP